MNTTDTIIAPATALGEGGIAVIRISGSEALSCLQRYFNPSALTCPFESHKMYHGILVDSEDNHIDEVMVVYMAGPRSYTAENTVEIHCHGSRQIAKRIIRLYQGDGIRIASPGEFTYRAFLNGRLDLSQAEAVARLIKSNSESSRRLALSHLEGALSRRIYSFSESIKGVLVLTEAWIDFPEEDLPAEDIDFISQTIARLSAEINKMLGTYDYGRVQTEGASILLIGEPNVGKSSLLNALLGEDRAIVTDVPGTTRDLLEEGLFIDDLPVRLIDTAGVRSTDDQIEVEGIRRALNKVKDVDLILYLVDENDTEFQISSSYLSRFGNSSVFIVLTKHDKLGPKIDMAEMTSLPVYQVSSKTRSGLDALKEAIKEFFCGSFLSSETVLLTERRHFDALIRARESLLRFSDLFVSDGTLDLMSFELREALNCLGMVSGAITTEDLLDDIFSGFCIGK